MLPLEKVNEERAVYDISVIQSNLLWDFKSLGSKVRLLAVHSITEYLR
mgnify:CR=1 FL=1